MEIGEPKLAVEPRTQARAGVAAENLWGGEMTINRILLGLALGALSFVAGITTAWLGDFQNQVRGDLQDLTAQVSGTRQAIGITNQKLDDFIKAYARSTEGAK